MSASYDSTQSALENVYMRLRDQTGHDFYYYKRDTIQQRVERRMSVLRLDTVEQYASYLAHNPFEVELLFKELLIGVTSFFRDRAAWQVLQRKVLKRLVADHSGGSQLRAWVAGCSTGEEAYSLAIALQEAADMVPSGRARQLRIFATDLDADAVDEARVGLYPESIAERISARRLKRFFIKEQRGYRVRPELRELIVFAPHNMVMDPPISKLDLLCCRNFLIYLSAGLQKKLLSVFHYCLKPSGVLFLGSAESAVSRRQLFRALDSQSRIYLSTPQPESTRALEIEHALQLGEAKPTRAHPTSNTQSLARLVDRAIAQNYAPLGVLCNDDGDILYVSGNASSSLDAAVGKANMNILVLARAELRHELTRVFLAAKATGACTSDRLTIQRLTTPIELKGLLLVVFARSGASTAAHDLGAGVARLQHDLQRARQELQTTREETHTFRQLLRQTSQELQSSNDRLQSSNDHLRQSQRELRSLNGELHAVIKQLQSKLDAMSRTNRDLENQLNSTEAVKPLC